MIQLRVAHLLVRCEGCDDFRALVRKHAVRLSHSLRKPPLVIDRAAMRVTARWSTGQTSTTPAQHAEQQVEPRHDETMVCLPFDHQHSRAPSSEEAHLGHRPQRLGARYPQLLADALQLRLRHQWERYLSALEHPTHSTPLSPLYCQQTLAKTCPKALQHFMCQTTVD